jgi:predicted component of type VI protein secretion system
LVATLIFVIGDHKVGMVPMKVQLVVVRGKPEGKVIPLVGPNFKIGRGETCHLRPNSEQVSREHAEFTIGADSVEVRDLGSRNGTLVNGKALTTDSCRLKDRDLVQVGPLTFAVAILDAAVAARPAVGAPAAPASVDDVSTDDIDAWLVGPNAAAAADQPTAVYGGETLTITAFRDAGATAAKPANPPSASDDEYERQPDDEDEEENKNDELEPFDDDEGGDDETVAEDDATIADDVPEEFLDESNPFYAAKKAQQEAAKQTGPAKPAFKDTSDAANDILRRLMERRRADRA